MRRGLYVMSEGATEVQFVESVLQPYFAAIGVHDVRGIDYTGRLSYVRYKDFIQTFLKREHDIVVTSLIDFYALRSDFPGHADKANFVDPNQKVAHIENAIAADINHHRFVPYIQLHEFEGLLFSSIDGFQTLPRCTAGTMAALQEIIDTHPNPELINDSPQTAPSKRLLEIIPGYQKTLYGTYIAMENGLQSIIDKCPRFQAWLDRCRIELIKD